MASRLVNFAVAGATLMCALMFTTAHGGAEGGARFPAVPAPVTQPAQETSLDGLGLTSQTVRGTAASLAVAFPAPATDLAASGSYLRVFFGHSAEAADASTLRLLVNDVALVTVPLSVSTADGSVFVVAVPTNALHVDRPNLVEFLFAFVSAGSASPDAFFGRIGAQTAMHYDLAVAQGSVAAYPYSLLGGRFAGSLETLRLTLALPSSPDGGELAAALRVVADTGRLLRPAHVELEVASASQPLRPAGSAALVVGRFDDAPQSAAILAAAGFVRVGSSWRAPGSARAAAPGEGVLATGVSPWDAASPLILVTGQDDVAVGVAAQALLGARRLGLTGRTAVVPSTDAQMAAPAADLASLPATLPGPVDMAGAGEHRFAFGLPVVGTDPSAPASLQLRFALSQALERSPGSPTASVDVDGGRAATVPLRRDAPGKGSATLPVFGVHAGVDGIAVTVRLPVGDATASLDVAGSSLRVAPPASTPSLDALPYPFVGSPSGSETAVIIAGLDTTTTDSAVQAMLALGSRSAVAPGALTVLFASRDRADRAPANVLVVGDPGGAPLRWRTGPFAAAIFAPPAVAAGGHSAWISETPTLDGGDVLWLGGDPAALPAAARALVDTGLRGGVAVVEPSGAARPVTALPGAGVAADQPAVRAVRLLPLLVLAALLGLVALRRVRRRDVGGAPTTLLVLLLAVGALVSVTVVGDTPREPVSLAVLLPAVVLVVAVAAALGPAPAALAAVLAAGAFAVAELATASQPFAVDFGAGTPSPDVSDLQRAAGSVWQAEILGCLAILATVPVGVVIRRLAASRSPRKVGRDATAAATFVVLSIEQATNGSRHSNGTGLQAVVGSALSGLHESAVVVGSRHDEAVGQDEVLVMLTGVAQDRAQALVHRMEVKARRQLRRPLRASVIVVERQDSAWDPGGQGGLGALLDRYAAGTRQVEN